MHVELFQNGREARDRAAQPSARGTYDCCVSTEANNVLLPHLPDAKGKIDYV